MNGHCIHQREEWLSIIVKNPHLNSKPRFICNRDLGGIFIGYKAPSEPAYASQTLVQIIQYFIPRLSTQKYSAQILLSIDHMQMYIFLQKLRKHYLVQDADSSKQNPPILMASKIALSGSQTSWTQWIYFQATQKSPARVSRIVHISIYEMDSKVIT